MYSVQQPVVQPILYCIPVRAKFKQVSLPTASGTSKLPLAVRVIQWVFRKPLMAVVSQNWGRAGRIVLVQLLRTSQNTQQAQRHMALSAHLISCELDSLRSLPTNYFAVTI